MDQQLEEMEPKEIAIAEVPFGLSQQALRAMRKARLENQTRFWAKFGVTQSRGSRFEMGMEIPPPITILLNLYFRGVISDHDLGDAIAAQHAPAPQAKNSGCESSRCVQVG